MEYTFLLGAVENVLGKSYKRAKDNHAFNCPFCNHKKPKLEINFNTNDKGENPWECWVCETKGRTIRSLLKQLKISGPQAQEVLQYIKKGEQVEYQIEKAIELPKEFQPLYLAPTTSFSANIARKYLYDRGITDNDILKYNIGYCIAGEFSDRIIIPSYDQNNQLNFYVARSFNRSYAKYKNPEASKDIIVFENLINWNQPIIICEGVFDAMAIRRNAIPILGKNISKSLLKKIVSSKVKEIYIALDRDALKKAVKFCEQFISMGKKVYLVDMDEKDPSEMGFQLFTNHIQDAEELDLSSLLRYKLNLL
jgi:DNA primase